MKIAFLAVIFQKGVQNMKKAWMRRLRRICQPMILGQRSLGFWMAAILIFCWQGTRTAQAALSPQGFSENDYFKLDWDYDLSAGTGIIWISSKLPQYPISPDFMEFSAMSLYTRGMTLNSIINNDDSGFNAPVNIGTENGKTLYEYAYAKPYPDNWLSAISFFKDFFSEKKVQIEVTFPTAGVGLYDSKMDYSGQYFNSALGMVILAEQQIPFVSVEMIPEPAAIALLGIGGLAGATLTSRNNRKKENQ
jgi:hypothetical protein